ncbi:MAG: sulfurtransferase [Bdellovibrionaceae bacterium]|nr:hypothetical protein [Bdellovibrionales bacterium]MCB9255258.1 sulfurtransferase [Pseudobdellovibrionaceae bacterium]
MEESDFQKRVKEAKAVIKENSIHEVKAKQDSGHQFFLVDTREDLEWEASRIKGAIHIGKGVLERDISQNIPDKNAEIILYCGGGSRSALAAESIQKMGYKNVINMAGGIRAWADADYPMES